MRAAAGPLAWRLQTRRLMRKPAGLTFALPPSMGLESLRPVARHLAEVFSDYGFDTVWPCRTYDGLEQALLSGEAHAAWAPPVLCAQAEAIGGATILRAVRGGSTSYRSALLCRGERSIDLKRVDAECHVPIRAAWVDPRSAAGCMMPRRYLRQRGANLDAMLEESFLGSYLACFDAVLEGDADLTASYVGRRGSGYIDLCGARARELRVLAWTEEIPNDGIVISPALAPDDADQVALALAAAFADTQISQSLSLALEADGFEASPPNSYAAVQTLLAEAAPAPTPTPTRKRQPRRGSLRRAAAHALLGGLRRPATV